VLTLSRGGGCIIICVEVRKDAGQSPLIQTEVFSLLHLHITDEEIGQVFVKTDYFSVLGIINPSWSTARRRR
jgi:hypothetical protein